jgi:hypothetical protein
MADRGIVVLQNCIDLEKHVPGPCSETYPASSCDANQAMNIKVEEISDIEAEEEDPLPMTFIGIKAEHEVSCLSVCPLFGKFHAPPELSIVCRYCSGEWILKSPSWCLLLLVGWD